MQKYATTPLARALRRSLLIAGLAMAVALGGAGSASAAIDRMIYAKDFDIYLADTDGGAPYQLTSRNTGWPLAYSAALSPNGQLIAYTDGPSGNLWLLDIGSRNLKKLYTNTSLPPKNAKFSPNGRKLIFQGGGGNSGDIYTINIDATGLTKVIGWKDGQADPDFSPNGTEIVFSSLSDPRGRRLLNSQNQLFITTLAGANPRQVTQYGTGHNGAFSPAYSPDGSKIAFVGLVQTATAQQGDIFTINSGGSGQLQLTAQNNFTEWAPTWSPDGQRIAFNSNRQQVQMGGYFDIYQVHSLGGDATPLIDVAMPQSAESASFREPGMSRLDYAAYEHRPRIYFDEDEVWRPVEMTHFIGETHRLCSGGTCEIISTTADLRRRPFTDAHIDIEGDGAESNYRSPAAECNVDGKQDCNSGNRSAIYYHVSDLSPMGYWYLDYWWFYRYSNSVDYTYDHEGDWEGVSVGISPSDKYTFDFANYAEHDGVYSYLRDNLACDGGELGSCGTTDSPTGQRVNVYPANGTHASYAFKCTQFPTCWGSNGVPDSHHGGEDEWGNNNDSTALYKLPPTAPLTDPGSWVLGPQEWTDWPGRWGKDLSATVQQSNSPGSPARPEGRFRTPWDADCTDDSCPIQQKLAAARAKPTSSSKPNVATCGGWFGGGVAAAASDQKALRGALEKRKLGKRGSFRIQVRRKGVRSDDAPGIAQAMGAPLAPGDKLVVSGASARSGMLLVRVAHGRRVYKVAFDTMGLGTRSGRAVLRVGKGTVRAAGARIPSVELVDAGGRSLRPSAVSR